VPDTAKAAELGVTSSAIAATINVATLGDSDQSLPKFNLPGRRVSVLVSIADSARNDPAIIANLPVVGGLAPVSLQSVAAILFGAGPKAIDRFDRRRSSTVEAALTGLTLGEANALLATLPAIRQLPPGVEIASSGDAERLSELLTGFAMAIAAGIILMYFTLVLLFGGFVQPITILVALPLSVGGALGLLLICGQALSIFPLIGILMLMGIAAKNSILLVEYAIVAIAQHGFDRSAALMDAAAKRARPIVMTSVAMGIGMLPIALGFGADSESRAPMAIAVIGGLISSTVLSLIYVPVVFTLMDDLQVWSLKLLRPFVNRRDRATA
jgi:multidrug efflux pump subunit AcrB